MPNAAVSCAILLVGCGCVFAPSIANGFTYDDAYYAKAQAKNGRNVMVETLHPIGVYFRRPYGFGVFRGRGFRPMTVYGFALTHHLFGTNAAPVSNGADETPDDTNDPAWPHHLLNVLLHVIATWLVYRMVCLVTGAGPPALLAAAFFGLHALRSDAVISIVGRAELQAFACASGALLFMYTGVRRKPAVSAWRMFLGSLLLFVAFHSKESAVVWAVFVPLFLFLVAPRDVEQERMETKSILALTAAISVPLIAFFVLRQGMLAEHAKDFGVAFNANPIYAAPWDTRIPTATMLLGYGLMKTFVPYPVVCDYSAYAIETAQGFADIRFLAALIALVVVLAIGLRSLSRNPLLFAAAAAFLGFSFVTSNLLVPVETIFAERLYYTPALGLSFLVAWLAHRCAGSKLGSRVLWIASGAWLILSAGICVVRCFDWQSNETLFVKDVTNQPRSVFLNIEAGRILNKQGKRAESEELLAAAMKIAPGSSRPLVALGKFRHAEGKLDQAASFLERAVTLPKGPDSEVLDRAIVLRNLGWIYREMGFAEKAIGAYEEALEIAPDFRETHEARVPLLWVYHASGDAEAMRRLLKGAADDARRRAPPLVREIAMAHLTMFQGLLAHRERDWKRAANLLSESLAHLGKEEGTLANVGAVVAYVDSVDRSGDRENARQILAAYLNRSDLPAMVRQQLEGIRSSWR